MKKLFALCLFIVSVFNFAVYSQESEDVSQVVLPVEVYIGDQTEVLYIFHSAIDFFPGEKNIERKELINPFEGMEDNFTVISCELVRNKMEYTIRFVIVPWKVGTIVFPPFNLNKALGIKTEDADVSAPEFNVALYPVQINSIVEKTDKRQIMPPVPPILIPGTTYIIFLLVLAAIVFLILFFRILLRFNAIRRKWKLYLLKRAYRKNADEAIKKIKKLVKNPKVTDIEFCSNLQLYTRNYLDFRFDYRFSAISSSKIKSAFEIICAGSIPEEIATAIDELAAMFVRTDYIRYAHDSIDSQLYPPAEHQAALVKHERRQLSEMVIDAIDTFESDEKSIEKEENNER